MIGLCNARARIEALPRTL